MKKIKTFADACRVLKLKTKSLPDISILPKKHQKSMTAYYKLVIIAEALNEGWTPDWSDHNQYKYTPWFGIAADKKRPAGFGFSGTYCDSWRTYTGAGSRLCFKTAELARYAGKQFAGLYQDFLLLK